MYHVDFLDLAISLLDLAISLCAHRIFPQGNGCEYLTFYLDINAEVCRL